MVKFRKKPIIVEAMRYVEGNEKQIINFTEGRAISINRVNHMTITSPDGNTKADIGDWVIKEYSMKKGLRFYPCKHDIFIESYEKIIE